MLSITGNTQKKHGSTQQTPTMLNNVWNRATRRAVGLPPMAARVAVMVVPMFSPSTMAAASSKSIHPAAAIVMVTAVAALAPHGSGGELHLDSVFPNPFNGEIHIPFRLDEDSEVEMRVYNAAGQQLLIRRLGPISGGVRETVWDGRGGDGVSADVAFHRAIAEATGITHQSPQAFWITNGTITWHTSHGAITRAALATATRREC